MSRGDRKEDIFHDEEDRRFFLNTLATACERADWQVHAYVFMGNHFHLVIETPKPNLVDGMKWLLGTYTGRFNRRHGVTGHLFAGRYKALLIDPANASYFRTVCNYVHLNPSRAGLLRKNQPLAAYPWSSWPAYVSTTAKRPVWLATHRLLGAMDIPKDSAAGRRRLEQLIEERRNNEEDSEYRLIRRGWCLGSDDFRRELLEYASRQLKQEHYGELRRESDEAKAERVLKEELNKRGWQESDLQAKAKGDNEKLIIAIRLRAETVASVQWIANRLQMGAPSYVNHLMWRKKVNNKN